MVTMNRDERKWIITQIIRKHPQCTIPFGENEKIIKETIEVFEDALNQKSKEELVRMFNESFVV